MWWNGRSNSCSYLEEWVSDGYRASVSNRRHGEDNPLALWIEAFSWESRAILYYHFLVSLAFIDHYALL